MGVDRLAIFQCCDLCAVLPRDFEALRQFAISWLDSSDPGNCVSRIPSPYFVGTNIWLGAALLHFGVSGDKFGAAFSCWPGDWIADLQTAIGTGSSRDISFLRGMENCARRDIRCSSAISAGLGTLWNFCDAELSAGLEQNSRGRPIARTAPLPDALPALFLVALAALAGCCFRFLYGLRNRDDRAGLDLPARNSQASFSEPRLILGQAQRSDVLRYLGESLVAGNDGRSLSCSASRRLRQLTARLWT